MAVKKTEKRKYDHVRICVEKNVRAEHNYWDDVHFIHQALPEIDYDNISTHVEIFGKKLSYPLVISGMTGGYEEAKKINENLAIAAERFKIGLGLGSMRPLLEDSNTLETYSVVNDYNIPLLMGNIGAPQIVGERIDDIISLCRDLKMGVLAVHFNYAQEIVQLEGDRHVGGVLEAISELAGKIAVVAKETGSGIVKDVAEKFVSAGVGGIDVGGMSGTSFTAVEYYRAHENGDYVRAEIGKNLWNWGIPTPVCVIDCRDLGVPLIATGGIRCGLDVARAISLGAAVGGVAGELLKFALKSAGAVIEKTLTILTELKAVMFLTSAKSVVELGRKKVIITGRLREWLEGYYGKDLWERVLRER